MKFNITAVIFWLLGAGIGYLIHGDRGALVGAMLCLSISFGLELLYPIK
jgi:hypothetical protein